MISKALIILVTPLYLLIDPLKAILNTDKESKNTTLKNPSFVCLNGKDPASLSLKQNLLEFSKGPCSPLIITPGLLSSVITVEIDCQVLRKEHPEVFKTCGWNACTKKVWEIWKSVPEREYRLWVPGVMSPLSIFTINEGSNFCWAKLVKLHLDYSKPIEDAIIEQKGFTVKPFGSSLETKGKGECGNKGITDLIGDFLDNSITKVFDALFERLKEMGYVPGLTYQSLPYDYRLSYRTNSLNTIFKENIDRLYDLTKKKVVLYGHSLGNVNIYHQLLKLSPEYKKEKIKNWVNIAGPLLGATKTLRMLISGYSDLMFFKNLIGLHLDAAIEAINNLVTLYELIPFDSFNEYDDEEWFSFVKKRIKYEKGEINFEDSGFQFLPKTTEKCTPDAFKWNDPFCRFNFFNTTGNFTIKVIDDEFKISNTDMLLTHWNLTETTRKMFDITRDDNRMKLENPQVPMINFFLRTFDTASQFIYEEDIKKYVDKDKFYNPSEVNGYGDGTVEIRSTILPSLKWAYEYDTKKENAYPIKFVEVCSPLNRRDQIYDNLSEKNEYEITKNEYVGSACECEDKKNAEECSHQYLVKDKGVIDSLSKIIISNSVSYTEEYESYVNGLIEEDLKKMITDCPQIIEKVPDKHISDIGLEVDEI